jgi:DNA-binding response OmpR family regulator
MKTILCIDDDAWVLETLLAALTSRGYQVMVTTSTNVAPRCIQAVKIDLLLLDLNMPTKHGMTVYRELGAGGKVPVLFVTGLSRSFDPGSDAFQKEYEKELQGARTDVLYKPFKLEDLYGKVEGLIGSPQRLSFRHN